MRILIVEDDRVLSLMESKMVERMGHQVVDTLTTGETAVDRVSNGEVDLILMDIMLEGTIDGIEAMKQIRGTSDVPVIYITGNSDRSTRERAKETSYIDYLVKPITFERLKKAIESVQHI